VAWRVPTGNEARGASVIDPRNPFLVRMSEQTGPDAAFLRMFGPGFLDVLPPDGLWDRVHIFRSAPGGGKTSLFRLFTPSALVSLQESQTTDELRELYGRLERLEVISDSGPRVLGVMVSCARNYALLEDLSISAADKERLFYSLITSRIIIGLLRGGLALRGLEWPRHLSRLSISAPPDGDVFPDIPVPDSGDRLFEWASKIELSTCNMIDSFGPPEDAIAPGLHGMHALNLLRADRVLCDGQPIAEKVLVLLDDCHKLTPDQRRGLLSRLVELRPAIGIWLAERLEALAPAEMLGMGATPGREFVTVNLEDYWRRNASARRFEQTVTNIADRRAKNARGVQLEGFAGHLQETLDGQAWHMRFERLQDEVRSRVLKIANGSHKYDLWISSTDHTQGSPRERALAWRSLEILVERDRKRGQQILEVGAPPDTEEATAKESSGVHAAAEYFLLREGKFPYYFGMPRLAALSSYNIEQFLSLSGNLFERVASAEVLRRPSILSPEDQEQILSRTVKDRWRDLPRRFANGRDLQLLLEAIGEFCLSETDRPTAPYAPGVTGVALSTSDKDALIASTGSSGSRDYSRLLSALVVSVSENLLEPRDEIVQGQKGKTWIVFYLNRWLCLHFGLPLQYGGWRQRTLADCMDWLDHGHRRKAE
jgi:hypothetical protein